MKNYHKKNKILILLVVIFVFSNLFAAFHVNAADVNENDLTNTQTEEIDNQESELMTNQWVEIHFICQSLCFIQNMIMRNIVSECMNMDTWIRIIIGQMMRKRISTTQTKKIMKYLIKMQSRLFRIE